MLVVQGDTSSAYGAAVAAFAAAIPVAHVEAGLRTFDHKMPWPEEEMRTAIDSRAALLFAPTEVSATNLKRERVEGAIHVTGNSGIDTLLAVLERLPPPGPRPEGPLRLLVTCHRREAWDAGLRSVAKALIDLARSHPLVVDFVLHPNPTIARTMRRLLGGQLAIDLLEPLAHPRMIAAMREADILLSDSGGVQEEAPALGVPLLVLREKTERPEGIASGNMILVGTDAQRIIDGVERLLDPAVRAAMGRRAFPFGDGRSAPRIAGHIRDYLESGAKSRSAARRA
jgi:UDP-N-acetylglucosamine 2-epimerase (non-hydrolysing)